MEKPEITKEYFLDKKIGLVADPNSQIGHYFPTETFKLLNLEPTSLDILYLNSHKTLRKYLHADKVDVIESYWNKKMEASVSKAYIHPMPNSLSQNEWYLKMQSDNHEVVCVIQDAITQLVEVNKVNKNEHINRFWPCANTANTNPEEIKINE